MLSDILRPDLVKVELEAENRREAIGELVDHLVQRHEISYALRDHVLEAVLENEGRFVSGMEQGIAVPHAVSDRVEDMICTLGTSTPGIPFDSRDGQAAHLIVLFVVPKRNYTGEVRILAILQGLLESPALREQILKSKDPNQIFAHIRSAEKEQAA